jgi:hypothetical protein
VHAGVAPQVQPPAVQSSAVSGSQGMHAAPLAPQALASVAVTHVEPEQHPPAQLVGLHIGTHKPELHASSTAH